MRLPGTLSQSKIFATPLNAALYYHRAGLNVLRIEPDRSKAPIRGVPWLPLKTHFLTETEIRQFFTATYYGIGIIYGAISGNAEAVDVDNAELWQPFYDRVLSAVPDLKTAPIVASPKPGYHLIYRCTEPVGGNQVFARDLPQPDPDRPGKFRRKTLIEPRGEGGYTVAPGSPPACHPSGKRYRLINGDYRKIPIITLSQREAVMT